MEVPADIVFRCASLVLRVDERVRCKMVFWRSSETWIEETKIYHYGDYTDVVTMV